MGIDGSLASYNLYTGEKYWESSLEMTLIDSYDSQDSKWKAEYYVPTIEGDILAFSTTSIWNTTAKVSDF